MDILIADLMLLHPSTKRDYMIECAKQLRYSDFNDGEGGEGKILLDEHCNSIMDEYGNDYASIAKNNINGKYDS